MCGPPGGWRCRFQGCCEESLYPTQPVHQGTMPIAADAGISRLPHPGIDLPSDRVGASQVALVVKKKKKPTCQFRRHKRQMFNPWVGKIPRRRACQPTPVFLLGESHAQRNLVGYSPLGHKELDTTKILARTHALQSVICRRGIFSSEREGDTLSPRAEGAELGFEPRTVRPQR